MKFRFATRVIFALPEADLKMARGIGRSSLRAITRIMMALPDENFTLCKSLGFSNALTMDVYQPRRTESEIDRRDYQSDEADIWRKKKECFKPNHQVKASRKRIESE